MDLTTNDRAIFQAIKQSCQDFGLKYSHHIYQDYLLTIIFRVDRVIIDRDVDLSIVLDTAYRSIALRCTLPQPIPQSKIRELYETLNQLNYKLAKIKIVIQHPDPKAEIRGEMELFSHETFKADNFKKVLARFLTVSSVFVPLIDDFLKGRATKDEVIGGVDVLNNLQEFGSENMDNAPGDFPYPS